MYNYYATKWKREPINDHKFTFINIHDFRDTHFWTILCYFSVVAYSLKSVLLYIADVWTTLVLLKVLSGNSVFQPVKDEYKWIFVASIICSFLILLWDIYKSRNIFKSQDIAFAFTDFICYSLYSLKSYSYYCLFHRIDNSKNTRDELAFFVFFRLKRWKRIMLAEAPRQIINGYTIYNELFKTSKGHLHFNSHMFYSSTVQSASLIMIILSFTMFFISILMIVIAIFLYIPLMCQIQGNLKEYVCHKIDKRIAKLVCNKSQRRLLDSQRRQLERSSMTSAMRSSSISPGDIRLTPSPTLPSVGLECEEILTSSRSSINSRKRVVSSVDSLKSRHGRRFGSKSNLEPFFTDDIGYSSKLDLKKTITPEDDPSQLLTSPSDESFLSSTTTYCHDLPSPLRVPSDTHLSITSRRTPTPTSFFSDLPTPTTVRSPATLYRHSPRSQVSVRSAPKDFSSPHHF